MRNLAFGTVSLLIFVAFFGKALPWLAIFHTMGLILGIVLAFLCVALFIGAVILLIIAPLVLGRKCDPWPHVSGSARGKQGLMDQ